MTNLPNLSAFSGPQIAAARKALEAEQARRKAENRLRDYRPYAKQREFHAAGATFRERLLMAGNQLGKTVSGSAEVAFHLTGLYPEWWQGHRFNRAIRAWAASVTGEATRDNCQNKLVGPPENESAWGTGFLPKDRLESWNRGMGTVNLLDNCTVRHVSGDLSTLGFKQYSQGREKWQGPTLDLIWMDEEPPLDIYMEALTRTNAVPDARMMLTFTPLLGMSEVVTMFLETS